MSKYNNAKHGTIKMKPIDVRDDNKRGILMNIMKNIVYLK